MMLTDSFQLYSPPLITCCVHRAVEFENKEVLSLPLEMYEVLWITSFASCKSYDTATSTPSTHVLW